ncbi:NYN domain-containing protein [Patescibacteria group bacterium]|nr:NYN domain-containing protein [Patescibacteria group bacterium]
MIKHPSQRVAVLIDTQNLYYSARNLYNKKVNFKSILEDAVAGRQLTRAIAYVVKTKTGEERPFFDALEKVGIETKEKELQIFFGGATKADWDVGLAIDAIVLGEKVDSIVIVSGDGDFIPLVQYLRFSKGVHVEIMAFKETTSTKLLEVIDDYIDLSANKEKYLMQLSKETAPIKIERHERQHKQINKARKGRPRMTLSSIK